MFKKKILIGHSEAVDQAIIEHVEKRNVPSEDTAQAIIEYLEKSNIPFEVGIEAILKQSLEVCELFYTVKVQKKYAKQVEVFVAQYVSQEDLMHCYKVTKKKSKKLERKEKAPYLFEAFICLNAVAAFQTSKDIGAYNVSFIVCAFLLMCGVFMTTKYYKAMKRKSGDWDDLIVGIALVFYAVYSFISVLRF